MALRWRGPVRAAPYCPMASSIPLRPRLSLQKVRELWSFSIWTFLKSIGAYLHVLFRKWLIEKGVDPKGVNFVEVTFPTMNDVLKSGSVDAVLTAEPFVARMTAAGTGHVGARYAAELSRTEPIILYARSALALVVITATPVGKEPSAFRKARVSKVIPFHARLRGAKAFYAPR